MTSKDTKEQPFKVILSREQQTFLKEQKQHLKTFLDTANKDEEPDEDVLKETLIIQAVFSLPVVDLNLFLIKEFANYPSVTKLAEDLHITKQTLCSRIKKTKIYIKNYVDTELSNRNSNH